ALLSQQLRRFLDDQVWLENRRIMDILHGVETKALALRHSPPSGEFMEIDDTGADVELPMERPLYSPPIKPLIANVVLEPGDEHLDAAALFSQVVIDKAALSRHIRNALQERSQITLSELIEARPLQYGLAELVAYLQLASDTFKAVVDEEVSEIIVWRTAHHSALGRMKGCVEGSMRKARLPRVIFVR
ncbi:MAG: DUF3375 family protein, partial [Thermodesulfovibrionales bacterium]